MPQVVSGKEHIWPGHSTEIVRERLVPPGRGGRPKGNPQPIAGTDPLTQLRAANMLCLGLCARDTGQVLVRNAQNTPSRKENNLYIRESTGKDVDREKENPQLLWSKSCPC